jgi:long-chain acyl-CoA synthetase
MTQLQTSAPPRASSLDAGFDVAETLAGKRILFIGGTGFVGKVAMSMLLCKYPGLG